MEDPGDCSMPCKHSAASCSVISGYNVCRAYQKENRLYRQTFNIEIRYEETAFER
jgi:hypothetical protein